MRAIIDTCVIIDAMQAREPFAEDAQNIFIAAANRQFVGCITAKSATDIYYIMHRYNHSDSQSRTVLDKLFKLFDVLDTAAEDCRRAIPSGTTDFEDAVMIETALRSGADCIITRNERDYAAAPVKIYSPSAFLNTLVSNEE